MSKTKELVTIIAPGVAVGLLALVSLGVVPVACLPRAAAMAALLLSTIAIIALLVDAARERREEVLMAEGAAQ
jgi:hypothetical protein